MFSQAGVKHLSERCEAAETVLQDRVSQVMNRYERGVWVALVRRQVKVLKDNAI